MQDGRRGRLPHPVEAWAELAADGELVDGVEPKAVIDGQLRQDPPLVLQPGGVGPAVLAEAGVDLGRERGSGRAAKGRAGGVAAVLYQHRGDGLGGEALAGREQTGAQRVVEADPAAGIDLHAAGEARQVGVLGDAVEGEVGEHRVAVEGERAVFGEGRDPEIDLRSGMQIGQDGELGRFVLPLVEQ